MKETINTAKAALDNAGTQSTQEQLMTALAVSQFLIARALQMIQVFNERKPLSDVQVLEQAQQHDAEAAAAWQKLLATTAIGKDPAPLFPPQAQAPPAVNNPPAATLEAGKKPANVPQT